MLRCSLGVTKMDMVRSEGQLTVEQFGDKVQEKRWR